jgi:hypothetical protein
MLEIWTVHHHDGPESYGQVHYTTEEQAIIAAKKYYQWEQEEREEAYGKRAKDSHMLWPEDPYQFSRDGHTYFLTKPKIEALSYGYSVSPELVYTGHEEE